MMLDRAYSARLQIDSRLNSQLRKTVLMLRSCQHRASSANAGSAAEIFPFLRDRRSNVVARGIAPHFANASRGVAARCAAVLQSNQNRPDRTFGRFALPPPM